MPRKQILSLLAGGDRRTTGCADEVGAIFKDSWLTRDDRIHEPKGFSTLRSHRSDTARFAARFGKYPSTGNRLHV
jgi:hypothetical protein